MAREPFWAKDGSQGAYYERKQREAREASRRARAEGEPTGLPWRDPNRVNGWTFLCDRCGAEVRCGWDDGFGLPEGVSVWDCRAEVAGECQQCGATYDVPINWWLTFEVEKPVRAGAEFDAAGWPPRAGPAG